MCNTCASKLVLLPSDVMKCAHARVSHPSDYAAGTVESGRTVIMDLMPGIIQYTNLGHSPSLDGLKTVWSLFCFDQFALLHSSYKQHLMIGRTVASQGGLSDF